MIQTLKPGNTNWRETSSTISLLVISAYSVKKVNDIYNIKKSYSHFKFKEVDRTEFSPFVRLPCLDHYRHTWMLFKWQLNTENDDTQNNDTRHIASQHLVTLCWLIVLSVHHADCQILNCLYASSLWFHDFCTTAIWAKWHKDVITF